MICITFGSSIINSADINSKNISDVSFTLNQDIDNIQSKSINSPMVVMEFRGKIEAVICGKISYGSLFD